MKTIQKATFPDGGFVLYKIPFSCKSRISAWFDKNGKLIDAQLMPNGRQIKEGWPAWEKAASYGYLLK